MEFCYFHIENMYNNVFTHDVIDTNNKLLSYYNPIPEKQKLKHLFSWKQ
jgi:hypothetical protein